MTAPGPSAAGSRGDGGAGTNSVPMVTRTVTCPRCRAEAMITYAQVDDDAGCGRHSDKIVYVCPNLCALRPGQVFVLIGLGQ